MKQNCLRLLLIFCAVTTMSTSVMAQRNRNYVKNAINRWGGCKNVAITKTNGDVALYGRNDYAVGSVPTDLANRLKSLRSGNHLIDDVTLSESGKWCVLYDTNDAAWTNSIPSGLVTKINEYHSSGYVVRSLTFNDGGEWCIVSDSYYATSSTWMTNWLKEGINKYGKLWSVCITDDGYAAVYANGFCYRGNIPESLKAALRSTSFDVYRLKISGTSWFFADTKGNYRYNM